MRQVEEAYLQGPNDEEVELTVHNLEDGTYTLFLPEQSFPVIWNRNQWVRVILSDK